MEYSDKNLFKFYFEAICELFLSIFWFEIKQTTANYFNFSKSKDDKKKRLNEAETKLLQQISILNKIKLDSTYCKFSINSLTLLQPPNLAYADLLNNNRYERE